MYCQYEARCDNEYGLRPIVKFGLHGLIWDTLKTSYYIRFLYYVCEIKLEDYVIFIYKWSMYTRYEYIIRMQEFYVKLKIDIQKF